MANVPLLLLTLLFFLLAPPATACAAPAVTPAQVIARMQAAYDEMPGYRMETEVREYRNGELAEVKSFRYSFEKPHLFRIDMHSPHRGATLIYSPEDGKVVVRPGAFGGMLKLRLSLENKLLASPSGQRIDQTDLGLLIRKLAKSFAEERLGEAQVTKGEGHWVLETVALDHFLPRVHTRYRVTVDESTWLPSNLAELTPEGVLKRTVRFEKVEKVTRFPDHFFNSDGKPDKGTHHERE